ncbi:GIN domain-containing protein [Sediminicola sp. 1XM1-17]|uniref:GIN domain-containing protein n=1 Tax=Sediminicola sp. 1XM1-17 TaxID=3127702 RepID=UPI0030788ADA
MKNVIVLLLLLCHVGVMAQRKPKIKGNREVAEMKEELPAFHTIELKDDLDIELVKAPMESYKVVADNNLMDILKFKVEDSTLYISSFYNIRSRKKLEITVYYNDLIKIVQEDGKMVSKESLNTDILDLDIMGSARMELNASAGLLRLVMDDKSSGDFNFAVDSLNVNMKERSEARIYAVGQSSFVELFSNASAVMEGAVDMMQHLLHDNADLKAERYEAKVIDAKLEGGSSAYLRANESLELSTSGSSKIYIYANPKITVHEFLDTSELIKRKD